MNNNQQQNKEIDIGFDQEQLAYLVRKCVGEFSIGDYSRLSGVSRSWISKSLGKRLESTPTQRILSLLYQSSQDPNVRFEELLECCGKAPDFAALERATANSIIKIQAKKNLILDVGIFINALNEMDKIVNDSFELAYQSDKYTIKTGDHSYLCYNALIYGNTDDEYKKRKLYDTVMFLLMFEATKTTDNTTEIFVLIDDQEIANNVQTALKATSKPISILFTDNYLSASKFN